ncbi:MAG: hypothetical protein ACOCWY_01040 [Thermodesulfobacteriota bacterium]
MAQETSMVEKMSNMSTSIFLLIVGLIFLIINFTVFPVFGFILGVLFIAAGIFFMVKARKKLSQGV